jgi:hypothetical protein
VTLTEDEKGFMFEPWIREDAVFAEVGVPPLPISDNDGLPFEALFAARDTLFGPIPIPATTGPPWELPPLQARQREV